MAETLAPAIERTFLHPRKSLAAAMPPARTGCVNLVLSNAECMKHKTAPWFELQQCSGQANIASSSARDCIIVEGCAHVLL